MMRRLAIIGGGFGGAIAAIHAMRAARAPLSIDIVEPRPKLGAGLAYSTVRAEHRLNVPSTRMILFDEDPLQFHDWLIRDGAEQRDGDLAGGSPFLFASRHDFGRFMEEVLRRTREAAQICRVTHHRSAARDIAPIAGGWRVALAGGAEIASDTVLLCIGHSGSAPPPPFAAPSLIASGRMLTDPWDADRLKAFGPEARFLVLGQGLTMGDVLASLAADRHRGRVTAVSRRGLLARPYTDFTKAPVPFEDLGEDARASTVVRLMRRACDDAVRAGLTWSAVIQTAREQGGALWQRLAVAEQRRLIRHARVFWDVHRYRMAPQVTAVIERARAAGRLRLLAGRAATVRSDGSGGLLVGIRRAPRDGGGLLEERFDAVVSCIGPTHDVARLENPLIRALLARRLAEPHPTGLGFAVGPDNVLVHLGRETPGIHVIGPLSRGAAGDVIGVPEISRQARAVVEAVLGGRASARAEGTTVPAAAVRR